MGILFKDFIRNVVYMLKKTRTLMFYIFVKLHGGLVKVLKKYNIPSLFFIAVLGIASIGFYSFVSLRYMGLDFDFSFNLLSFICRFSTGVFPVIMNFVVGFISYKISNYIFKAIEVAIYNDINISERQSYKLLFISSQILYFAAVLIVFCGVIYLMRLFSVEVHSGFFNNPNEFVRLTGFEFVIISLFTLVFCLSKRR